MSLLYGKKTIANILIETLTYFLQTFINNTQSCDVTPDVYQDSKEGF